MAMKLYSDVSVQNIANSIRKINGSSTTYKISQMAPAIDASFAYIINNIPLNELNGTTNQTETITDGVNLQINGFSLNGKSSQTGTPTIHQKADVTCVTSVSLTIEDENQNIKTKVFNLNGNELYGLQDGTKDTLYIQNGHLYIDKKIKKAQLTSNVTWSYFGNPMKAAYSVDFQSINGLTRGDPNLYSNCFTYSGTVWELPYKIGWGNTTSTLWLSFDSAMSDFSNIQQFKDWLDENNCYVIGKATTTQTIDLGEIEDIFTYDGTNNITVTTNLGTTYELEYRQDVGSLIEQLEEV